MTPTTPQPALIASFASTSPQAISYIRFSSERQRGGSSVERQEAMIADWLENNPGYRNADLKFSDLAKSGFHGEHVKEGGGFGKLLAAIQAGLIRSGDVVLVEAIDRTGRLQPLDMITQVIGPILNAGVSIITLDDNTVYTKDSVGGPQIFLLVAKIQAAHGYSKTLSERVTAAYVIRRQKAREGTAPRRATPVWLDTDGTERKEITPWINTAFELYVSGVGKATIAKRMRESGVQRLSKCSGPTVDGWLKNKATIGKWDTKEGVIDNVYPQIIPLDLFYKAQMHAEKVKTQRPKKTAKNFLVGLVVCNECGKNYIMQNLHGKPHSLRCRTRQAKLECPNSNIIPKPVIDYIYKQSGWKAAMEALQQLELGVDEQAIFIKEAELAECERRINNLIQLAEDIGRTDVLVAKLKDAMQARDRNKHALILLQKSEVIAPARGWLLQGKLWQLQEEDTQRLSALLRTAGFKIVIKANGEITCSHDETTYRYNGWNRTKKQWKVLSGSQELLIDTQVLHDRDEDYIEPPTPQENLDWLEE